MCQKAGSKHYRKGHCEIEDRFRPSVVWGVLRYPFWGKGKDWYRWPLTTKKGKEHLVGSSLKSLETMQILFRGRRWESAWVHFLLLERRLWVIQKGKWFILAHASGGWKSKSMACSFHMWWEGELQSLTEHANRLYNNLLSEGSQSFSWAIDRSLWYNMYWSYHSIGKLITSKYTASPRSNLNMHVRWCVSCFSVAVIVLVDLGCQCGYHCN